MVAIELKVFPAVVNCPSDCENISPLYQLWCRVSYGAHSSAGTLCVSQANVILCAQVDLPAYLHRVIYIYVHFFPIRCSINWPIASVRLSPLYLLRQGD